MLTRRAVVGFKLETTQNTPVAATATDMVLVQNPVCKINGEVLERDFVRASLDRLGHLVGKAWFEFSGEMEFKASGSAGTEYAPLSAAIQACGMSVAAVGGTSVTHAPLSAPASNFFSPGKSISIEVYLDGVKHVAAGSVGNAKLRLNAGMIPMVAFEFKGIYAAISDAALPSATYLATLPKIVQSSTLTLAGVATHKVNSLEIDFGNVVSMRDDVNSARGVGGFLITDRSPVGSVDPEMVLKATDDFWLKFIDGTIASTSIVIGAGSAGNIITITLPKTQYFDPSYGDRNGIRTFQSNLRFSQNAGDDWISIVMT